MLRPYNCVLSLGVCVAISVGSLGCSDAHLGLEDQYRGQASPTGDASLDEDAGSVDAEVQTDTDVIVPDDVDATVRNTDDGKLRAKAVNGSIELDYNVAASGKGSDRLGAIEISGGAGKMTFDNEVVSLLTYSRQPNGDYVVFQGVSIKENDWITTWIYCLGGKLNTAYSESANGLLSLSKLWKEPAAICRMSRSQPAFSFPFLKSIRRKY